MPGLCDPYAVLCMYAPLIDREVGSGKEVVMVVTIEAKSISVQGTGVRSRGSVDSSSRPLTIGVGGAVKTGARH
jgi:hypothetical protein